MRLKRLSDFSEVYKDTTRIRMAAIWLYVGETNSTDLAHAMNDIVGKINRHVIYFKRYDFVKSERHSQSVIYDLKDFHRHKTEELFALYEIEKDPIIQNDLKSMRDLEKKGLVRSHLKS